MNRKDFDQLEDSERLVLQLTSLSEVLRAMELEPIHDASAYFQGPTRMFGVVLWAQPDGSKAVIWCEDQGELAFWNTDRTLSEQERGKSVEPHALDTGDLIQFDLSVSDGVRQAQKVRVLLRNYLKDNVVEFRKYSKNAKLLRETMKHISNEIIVGGGA